MINTQLNTLITEEFAVDEQIIYLNHAAVSPWPHRTRNAIVDFAEQNVRQGSVNYPQWLETENALRQKMQSLINAPSINDIALVKNTSEALSMVAYGINWQRGDNIVITNQEFPSNHIVWDSLQSRGVELRVADISQTVDSEPEHNILALCDPRTRLVSVSSIQFASGQKLHLKTIGNHCRSNNILFCVDAIQSVGAVAFDVQSCHANFAMADGHKWMLGPEGLGFFYCDAAIRDQLSLTQYGWHMVENVGDYDAQQWSIAKSARRFECGSPNMLGIHALNASLSLLLEAGTVNVEQRVRANTRLMLEQIERSDNLELLSPPSVERLGGIVSFRHRKVSTHDLYQQLTTRRIFCAERGGGIRFSPHFYTDSQQIITALHFADQQ